MFDNYHALLKKVDDKFAEIADGEKDRFKCEKGCADCCEGDLTVSPIEREHIRQFLKSQPERVKEARPKAGMCPFLSRHKACVIYEVRPVICRSHGAPIRYRDGEKLLVDSCPINFSKEEIETVSEEHFINIEILNTLLTLINSQQFPKTHEKRYRLTPDGILGD